MDQNNNPSTQPPELTPGEQPPTLESVPPQDTTTPDSTPQNAQTAEPAGQPVPPTPAQAPRPAPLQGAQAGAPITSLQQRNLLAAFLLTAHLGITGLHQVYLGRATQGWIRFALLFAAIPLSFIIIGFLIYPVLIIWTIVDFFIVALGKRVDGQGMPLAYTPRDEKWVKVIFFANIAFSALYILLVASMVTGSYYWDNSSPGSFSI